MNKNEYTELHLFVENGVDKGEAYLKDIYMALKRWLPKDYKLLPDLRFTNLFIGEVPKFNCFITIAHRKLSSGLLHVNFCLLERAISRFEMDSNNSRVITSMLLVKKRKTALYRQMA